MKYSIKPLYDIAIKKTFDGALKALSNLSDLSLSFSLSLSQLHFLKSQHG